MAACGARSGLNDFLETRVATNGGTNAGSTASGTAGLGSVIEGSGGVTATGSGGAFVAGTSSGASAGVGFGGTAGVSGMSAVGGTPASGGMSGIAGSPSAGAGGVPACSDASGAGSCGSNQVCVAHGGTSQCVSIAAPRLLAPLSTATVTSHTPTFHWQLPSGSNVDGAEIEIFVDRACTHLVTEFTATGVSGTLPVPLTPGVYFWRARGTVFGVRGLETSPVWELFVGAGNAPVNTSWGTTLDVNGDGFADVLVGANGLDQGASGLAAGAGAGYLYLGTANGVAQPPTVLPSPPGGTLRGFLNVTVASAGDVNGDGFADVLVASHDCIVSPASGAYLYLGGPAGVSIPPTPLNVDMTNTRYCARSFAAAGDLNGDGYADIAIGAIVLGNSGGAVNLFFGSKDGISTTPVLAPKDSSQYYGIGVASAGDVNGDGFGDLAVGGYGGWMGNVGVNGFFLFLGGPQGLTKAPQLSIGPFGSALDAADINEDGYSDVLVGNSASSTTESGSANVYLGGPTGISTTPAVISSPAGMVNAYNFGRSVANAGDVNADGYADMIVSAPAFDVFGETTGIAYLYLGSTLGPSATGTVLSHGPSGTCAATGAGDVDGNGAPDILLGNCTLDSFNGTSLNNSTAFVYSDTAYLLLNKNQSFSDPPLTVTMPSIQVQASGFSLQ